MLLAARVRPATRPRGTRHGAARQGGSPADEEVVLFVDAFDVLLLPPARCALLRPFGRLGAPLPGVV